MSKPPHLIAIAVACALAAPSAFAQAMSAGQRPPVNPTVVSPVTTINCPPSATGGQPTCSTLTKPQPIPVPLPPPPPKPAVRIMHGLAAGAAEGGEKVLSYFQRGAIKLDTANAFGFVLIPKAAVTERERNVQRQFCEIMLASLDFMAPDAIEQEKVLATYWPISPVVGKAEVETAFRDHDCENLIAWYDHSLARALAAKADIAHLSGPLLITWPSRNAARAEDREPLIVDFANADYDHATKALQYWFRELRSSPALWTNRIREGTIRAELADAINDTAGVMLAVLHGKWDSIAAVSETP